MPSTLLTLALAVALANATPSDAADASTDEQPTRLAAPGLSGVQLDDSVVTFYTQHLAHQMSRAGVPVTTPEEISALIGLKRQRALLGCDEESCIAEIGAALGVEGIVTGSIGRFGDSIQLNLKVISSNDGATLASYTGRAKGDDAILDLLSAAGKSLAGGVLAKLGRKPVFTRAEEGQVTPWPLAPTIAGGVLAAAGGTLLFLAGSAHTRLQADARAQNVELSPREASALAQRGSLMQTAGWVGVGLGAAALASSALIYQFSGPQKIETSVAVTPGAAAVTFSRGF